jgi:hypothetical protein
MGLLENLDGVAGGLLGGASAQGIVGRLGGGAE